MDLSGCAACGCPVDAGKLLCEPHWRAVPYEVRSEMYRQATNAKKGVPGAEEKLRAAKQAILAHAQRMPA